MRRRIWRGWILCLCACLLLCGAASGTGSTPADAVSRGAFADALYDAHVAHGGAPVVSEGSSAPFRDVGSWSPYFEALCWAKASGIAGGYAGGAFRPAAPVTRQQATVMLYRYAKTTDLPLEKGSDRDLAGYRDADTIPTWSREAVQWAVRNGLWFSGSATELQAAENVSWEGCEEFFARKDQTLATLSRTFGLTSQDPWEMVKALQGRFDPSVLTFSPEYYNVLGLEQP